MSAKLKIKFNGQTDSLTGWAKRLGISPSTLYKRLYGLKWPAEKALSAMPRHKRRQEKP